MTPMCSIVIRAYNEARHIGKLLKGIQQQTIKDVQVILVDSGSTDGTAEIAQKMGAEVVSINPRDFTFGRSLNLGIEHARADRIVIASAHVYPLYPDWLEVLLAPLEDQRTALTYGKQRGNHSNHFSEHQVFRAWFPDDPRPVQKHPFCNNANAAIQRRLWELHPYDELIPALEDLAWAKWAQEQGYRLTYVPEAEIIHVHQETWRGVFNRYRREGMAFRMIYPQETFGWLEMLKLFMQNVSTDWQLASSQKIWRQVAGQVVRFRWAQFNGTYRGYQTGLLTTQLRQAFYYPGTAVGAVDTPQRDVPLIHYEDADSGGRNDS